MEILLSHYLGLFFGAPGLSMRELNISPKYKVLLRALAGHGCSRIRFMDVS